MWVHMLWARLCSLVTGLVRTMVSQRNLCVHSTSQGYLTCGGVHMLQIIIACSPVQSGKYVFLLYDAHHPRGCQQSLYSQESTWIVILLGSFECFLCPSTFCAPAYESGIMHLSNLMEKITVDFNGL